MPLLAWSQSSIALDPTLDVSQYAHTAWRIREGFGNGPIASIAQTTDGYLWLGGQSGLVRFDGVRSVVWQPPAGEPLPDEHILSLLGTHDGTLWIGTWKGLASWKAGRLTSYRELSTQLITTMFEDHEGVLWVGAPSFDQNAPAMFCTIRSGEASCKRTEERVGRITSLREDDKQQMWAITTTGLWRLGPGAPEPKELDRPVSLIAGTPAAAMGLQEGLAEGPGGALLIGTVGGITRLVDGTVASPFVALPGVEPSRLLRDRDGGLWIATTKGSLMHVSNGRTDTFGRSDGLSGEAVDFLFEDREGSIWVATDEGLDRFRDLAAPTVSARQGLSNAVVWSVLQSHEGSIWISAQNGLDRWHNGEITVYRPRHEDERHVESLPEQERFSVRQIDVDGFPRSQGSLFEDRSGRLWIATSDSIGYLEKDRYRKLEGVPGGIVDAIAQDVRGDLWFAHRSLGLLRVTQDRLVEQIPWATLSSYGTVSALAADPKNHGLWLGFLLGGIAHFVDGTVRQSYFAANGLADRQVLFLRAERDGTLWIGAQGGLSRLKDGRIATLNRSGGLPCDPVDWMVDDDTGAVWVQTDCGIARIDRSELEAWERAADRGANRKIRAAVFDTSDGVPPASLLTAFTPHVAKASDGKLWFLATGGVGVLDPRHLPRNVLPPPVHVEQIIADRKMYEAGRSLQLPPLLRDLEIDYTALSLAVPEKVIFRYKLEGHDRDWQEVGNRRQAFYTDLPPGNYRFRVIASNNSGVWNEQGASVGFSIAAAFWQTLWFRVACVAAFTGLLWSLYLLRLRRLAREFELTVDARVAERTRIARDLHDTLLQSFGGLLLNFKAALRLFEARPTDAKQMLATTIVQAAQALKDGRNAVQGVRNSVEEPNDLVEAIRRVAEELSASRWEVESNRGSAHQPIGFSVAVQGLRRRLHPIVRDEIYRIAAEALRNAFEHSGATRIEVELGYDARQFRLWVRDDGLGFDPGVLAAGGREGHFGLAGMRERAELAGGKLTLRSAPGAGTEVEVTIPASRAHAAAQHTGQERTR